MPKRPSFFLNLNDPSDDEDTPILELLPKKRPLSADLADLDSLPEVPVLAPKKPRYNAATMEAIADSYVNWKSSIRRGPIKDCGWCGKPTHEIYWEIQDQDWVSCRDCRDPIYKCGMYKWADFVFVE